MTARLLEIEDKGGMAVAQVRSSPYIPACPEARRAEVNHCLPFFGIPSLLASLAEESMPEDTEEFAANPERTESLGAPSIFSCLERGAAVEGRERRPRAVSLPVGHAYTTERLTNPSTGIGVAANSASGRGRRSSLRRVLFWSPRPWSRR